VSHYEFGGNWSVPDELIPAFGARRTGVLDPREPQETLYRAHGKRTAWKTDYDKGELTITAGSTIPSLSEIKFEAAAFRKVAPLVRIVMFLDPEIFREQVRELAHLHFERDERREDARQRAFVVVRECPAIRRKPCEPQS
jgi:hypothetical protein